MTPSPVMRRLLSAAVAVPCVVAVAIWGELSIAALLAVVAVGAVGSGMVRRSGETAPPVGRRGLPWLGWLTAAEAWELGTLADDELPTASDLASPLLAHLALRGAATVCWPVAGAWLRVRPGRPRHVR